MTQTAQIIQFQGRRMADTEDGWFKLSNTLSEMLCRVQLSGREFRFLHAVIHKTTGYRRESDWVAARQIEALTGLSKSHQSDIKRALVERKILIKNGREIGVNLEVSDWVLDKKFPKTGTTKVPENGYKSSRKQVDEFPKTGTKVPENGDHNKKDTFTKEDYLRASHSDGTQQPPPKPSGKASSRATQLPEAFQPGDKHKALAGELGVNLAAEFEQFCDHHMAKGSKFKDWNAALRTWLRNAAKWGRNKPSIPAYTSDPNDPLAGRVLL